jgi:hypothetical protein
MSATDYKEAALGVEAPSAPLLAQPWDTEAPGEGNEPEPGAASDWKRWYDYLPRRLYMLRWVLVHSGKSWHPESTLAAKLRCIYWSVGRGYDTEVCARCGRPVRLVFHCPDWLWETCAGFDFSTARSPDGEAGGGCLCPRCVDELVTRAYTFPRWTFTLGDSAMVDRAAAASRTGEERPDA